MSAPEIPVSDYSTVTETPADAISREAASMMRTRYDVVASRCDGARVLELCCGAGQGLGYLAARAAQVVGADISASLLSQARETYRGKHPLVQLDAHRLPFAGGAFDVVAITEALYYFRSTPAVFQECMRVLSPSGTLILACVNPERPGFNPSPFAVRYLTAPEIRRELQAAFPDVTLMAGFPEGQPGVAGRLLSLAKRIAVAMHLIPRTMRGKRFLKRIVFGELVSVPAQIGENFSAVAPLVPAPPDADLSQFKVIYAIARKQPAPRES